MSSDSSDDDLLFADEDEAPGTPGDRPSRDVSITGADHRPGASWKILVVDYEPEIHALTQLVLSDIRYRDRGVRMLSAHSAAEAEKILLTEGDVACILLDVVMETDDAGLRFVRHVRQDLGNTAVRIILRTGQPGQAPEREVIVNYDINDYKAKTELTAQKLFTTVIGALRSYEDIVALEMSRRGLQRILEASASLFQERSMRQFASGVLTQLTALLEAAVGGILCAQKGSTIAGTPDGSGKDVFVLAGSGEYERLSEDPFPLHSAESILEIIRRTLVAKQSEYGEGYAALYIPTPNRREVVAYLRTERPLSVLDRQLVEVFCAKVSVGFDNVWLYEQLKRAHQATVVALADLAEYKDNDTGSHVMRIEELSERTARRLYEKHLFPEEINDLFLEQIGLASVLHDVGKVSTPDSILQKPGRLTPAEWAIMQNHAANGGAILGRAERMVEGQTYLTLGTQIANCHHERWDGCGYPKGLKGEEIPLAARIVAVADVYDALVNIRPYKEAWPVHEAVAYLREASGKQFDPRVVDAFLETLEEEETENENGPR